MLVVQLSTDPATGQEAPNVDNGKKREMYVRTYFLGHFIHSDLTLRTITHGFSCGELQATCGNIMTFVGFYGV